MRSPPLPIGALLALVKRECQRIVRNPTVILPNVLNLMGNFISEGLKQPMLRFSGDPDRYAILLRLALLILLPYRNLMGLNDGPRDGLLLSPRGKAYQTQRARIVVK